tara:strand:- start:9019 stop:9162 length:144 start_codon:yes stop_codon:yes gene_type:complete
VLEDSQQPEPPAQEAQQPQGDSIGKNALDVSALVTLLPWYLLAQTQH